MLSANKLQEMNRKNEELTIELDRLRKTKEEMQEELKSQAGIKCNEETLKWAELDVINMNLQASRRQTAELQKDNELLRAQLEEVNESVKERERMIAEILKLENELAALRSKLIETEDLIKGERKTKQTMLEQIRRLEAELASTRLEYQKLDEQAKYLNERLAANKCRIEEIEKSPLDSSREDATIFVDGQGDLTITALANQRDYLQKKNAELEDVGH